MADEQPGSYSKQRDGQRGGQREDAEQVQRIQELEAELERRQAELDTHSRELAQSKAVLVETLQQLRHTRNELEAVRSEAEATEKSNLVLQSRLKAAEETFGKLQLQLHAAQLEAEEARGQVDGLKDQRNAYLWETNRLEEALQKASERMAKLDQERGELGEVVQRANANTEVLRKECLGLKKAFESASSRLNSALEDLELAKNSQANSEAEQERLTKLLVESQNLVFLQEEKEKIAELELKLGDLSAEAEALRNKYARVEQERNELKESNVNLRLQLASARAIIEENPLEQENEQLRAVLERANEQIRALDRSARVVPYVQLNEPVEPEEEEPQRYSTTLRWLQTLLAKWGHSV